MRANRSIRLLVPLGVLWLAPGCRGDTGTGPATVTEGESESSSGEGTETSLSPTSSSSDPVQECGVGVPACEDAEYPLPGAPFAVAGPEVFALPKEKICANAEPGIDTLFIQVFRPDPLPDVPLPMVVLTNGQGQQADAYEHVLRPLAAMGFVAASVQSEDEVISRANAMACALRWLRNEWFADNCATPSCDLVLIGHSRGAEAAWLLGRTIGEHARIGVHWMGLVANLRALIGIAPRYRVVSPYEPDRAVPYLGIMGATDDDVPGNVIAAYDDMIQESMRTESDPGKLLLWPYDIPHNAFGGVRMLMGSGGPEVPALEESEYLAKGHAVVSAFVPMFVDLFVFGNTSLHSMFTGEVMPAAILDPGWWDYLDPAFSELGGGPVIPRDFVLDQRATPGIRRVLEDFEDPDAVHFDSTLAPDQIVLGSQGELALDTGVQAFHGGTVMRVRWGDPDGGGEITWELDGGAATTLEDFSFFSLRIGQELMAEDLVGCSLAAEDPHAGALELTVRLRDAEGVEAEAALGPMIQQHSQLLRKNVFNSPFCSPHQFMSTVRIAMKAFCDTPGFDITSVVSLSIEFPDMTHDVGVYLDTLEFTRHPLDEDNACM